MIFALLAGTNVYSEFKIKIGICTVGALNNGLKSCQPEKNEEIFKN